MSHVDEPQSSVEIAKKFCDGGYWVFPLGKSDRGRKVVPYGWAKNDVIDPQKADKVIAATNDVKDVESWPVLMRTKYKCEVGGFGILGEGCVVIDVDVKNKKPGFIEFSRLLKDQGIPSPTMMTITKSGGVHVFYQRPESMKESYVKTLVGVSVDGQKYIAVDLRGNGGYVVGPERFIPHLNVWKSGIYATKDFCPIKDLPIFPEKVLIQWIKAPMDTDLDGLTMIASEEKSDFRSLIRKGEIPDFIPKGARNESFYIFINVLKGKGVPVDVARQMCEILSQKVEESETFPDSVDVESMLQRVYVMQANSPYDVAVDLINHGLFQLTDYKSSLSYVILEDNPYLASKNPHDEKSLKTLLAKYQKTLRLENGKTKLVNPVDVITRVLHDENRADSIGFKPKGGQVFTLHNDPGSKRYVNIYREIHNPEEWELRDDEIWPEFKLLVSRIFGYEGTTEYDFAMDFVAWLLQKPHIKPSIAPFITSLERGVGKSLFFNVLIQLLGTSKRGERQARLTKIDEITGRFFDPTGCVVNLIDEVQFPAHRDVRKESVTFWRHLKNLITAETVSVEIKGGSTHQLPNAAAMMLAGNSGSSFPIEEFDRRLWVIDNGPPILEVGLVDRLFSLVTGSGIESDERMRYITSLRYHLYRRKIKTNLAIIRAPMNDIKREMMLNALTNTEEWFVKHFEDKDNLLAYTPVISKSAFIYLVETVMPDNVKRQDNPEILFRDFRRRGHLRPIRLQNKPNLSRQVLCQAIGADGRVKGQVKDILYTTREHGKFDNESTQIISHLYVQNVHTINEFRDKSKAAFKSAEKWVEGIKEEKKGEK